MAMDKLDPTIKAFGTRVKQLRTETGISQEAFAQAAGIDRSYYGRIERCAANPTLKNIAAIAQALGVGIGELFDEKPKIQKKFKRLP